MESETERIKCEHCNSWYEGCICPFCENKKQLTLFTFKGTKK